MPKEPWRTTWIREEVLPIDLLRTTGELNALLQLSEFLEIAEFEEYRDACKMRLGSWQWTYLDSDYYCYASRLR